MRFYFSLLLLFCGLSLSAQSVVINEFQADNEEGPTDEAGQHEDWLELYNNSSNSVSLNGMFLTDNPDNLAKWPFPDNTSIPSHGYLIVWLDEDQADGPYHASFKLSAAGEFLMLSNGAGTVWDSLTFGPQQPTATYGRFPNGTGAFNFLVPSYNASNSTVSNQEPALPDWKIVPNPASDLFTLQCEKPLGKIRIMDSSGRLVQESRTNDTHTTVQVKDWPKGVYTVRVRNSVAKVVVE